MLAWLLALALVVHLGAHVVLAIGLARRAGFGRALVAFFVPPLAPYWGWQSGLHRETYAWGGALAAYALGVMLVTFA
jgi:hypothetical protein